MNYLYILNIEKFVRNFYQRMFILDDRIDTIRMLIENFRHDPSNIVKVRRGRAGNTKCKRRED